MNRGSEAQLQGGENKLNNLANNELKHLCRGLSMSWCHAVYYQSGISGGHIDLNDNLHIILSCCYFTRSMTADKLYHRLGGEGSICHSLSGRYTFSASMQR